MPEALRGPRLLPSPASKPTLPQLCQGDSVCRMGSRYVARVPPSTLVSSPEGVAATSRESARGFITLRGNFAT